MWRPWPIPLPTRAPLAAVKLVAEYLPQAVANGDNLEARDKMAYAEYLAGMAFNNAGIGIVHAMATSRERFSTSPTGSAMPFFCPTVAPSTSSPVREDSPILPLPWGSIRRGWASWKSRSVVLKPYASCPPLSESRPACGGSGGQGKRYPDPSESAIKDICCLFNPRKIRIEDITRLYREAM